MRNALKNILLVVCIIAVVAIAVVPELKPHVRPNIRILDRSICTSYNGDFQEDLYILQWSIDGVNQFPAQFTIESERDRFEKYLGTIGEVSE